MSLSCEVVVDKTFLSEVKIMWRLDRELIISSGNANIIPLHPDPPITEVSQEVLTDSVLSSLSRPQVAASDQGRYDCVCVTRLDSATSRAGYLTVNGKQPAILRLRFLRLSMSTKSSESVLMRGLRFSLLLQLSLTQSQSTVP